MTQVEIKKLRKSMGITQVQISGALGITLKKYREWECGGKYLKPQRAHQIDIKPIDMSPEYVERTLRQLKTLETPDTPPDQTTS